MGKKFGQHFLKDKLVLDNIAEIVFETKKELWCDSLIEIGPGQGVLTKLIIQEFEKVTLLEVDGTLEKYLDPFVSSHANLDIVRWDVLKNKSKIDVSSLMVWNLPYYITSPIFRKFFVEQSCIWGVFLIQKEVGEKIKTITKQKSYLRRLLNYWYTIEYCFIVSATAFDPPPKVQSAVVKLTKKEKENIDFDRMIQFLEIVSQYTRKTLRKIRKMREEDLQWFILPKELEGKRLQELNRENMSEILKK